MNTIDKLKQRYLELAHAMQSGVAMMMNFSQQETDPKHLRVGVNSAMVDSGALAGLLIEKGIITEEEYLEALNIGMQQEVDRYRQRIEEQVGGKVSLG